MERNLKVVSSLSLLLISLTVAYYFLYRPAKKQFDSKSCYNRSINVAQWSSDKFRSENEKCMAEKGWQ